MLDAIDCKEAPFIYIPLTRGVSEKLSWLQLSLFLCKLADNLCREQKYQVDSAR